MQSNKFYRDNVHVGDFFIARLNGTVRVVKCTRVYDHIVNRDKWIELKYEIADLKGRGDK